jgi:hypothetical protein
MTRTAIRYTLFAFALLCLAASPGLAQTGTLKTPPAKWTGCCAHCSQFNCSGCTEASGPCDPGYSLGNCTTIKDQTVCSPARKKKR